jgi:hypothetical protein
MREWRRTALSQLALALGLGAVVFAQGEDKSQIPTWQDEIAKGLVPYHQLAVDDFRIDDKTHSESGYSIKPFIDPRYHYILTRNGGWYYAYLERWIIFSGIDKNQTWRKSKFPKMERSLPHAQAYLDLNEICARQLAALKAGELPSGRGATIPEAAAALHQTLDAFLKEKYKALQAEGDAFQKATNHGANTKKVLELGKAIRKRLDALPTATEPVVDSATPTPSATPTTQASSSPVSK